MTALPIDSQRASTADAFGAMPAMDQVPSRTGSGLAHHTFDAPPPDAPNATAELRDGYQDTSKAVHCSDPSRTSTDGMTGSPTQAIEPDQPGQLVINQDGLATHATMAGDGRVQITINQSSRKLAKLLRLTRPHQTEAPVTSSFSTELPPPALNIVIQVVGSRGDVQPFVALGKALKEQYNHRVRLATHATFKGFVEENGLEFFNIGGDPAALMAFMVKNPGLMPGFDSLRHGDVGKRQREIFDILLGCWRSCIEAGDGMDLDFSEDQDGGQSRPFVADAIIANPPSFAHIHCAEKLGVPVHLMFTMPWSPTQAFPHPLANVQSSNADPHLTNLISYTLVEALTWQGLGHVINRFREQNLRLDPVSLMYAPSILNRLHIPYTYCWSPALIPKPKDWGSNISISGFYFLSLASTFTPSIDLQEFLDAGPPPVYIGFGSIVVDDPDAMTAMIFEAIKKAGVRALVSKGWGGIGKGDMAIPERVFMLGNTPHDWLFKRVSCVVHHGGAGTTAAGIALGKPTVVVPFFGDQPFWGAMIARAGAGPIPIPYKKLTAEILAASIAEALQPAVQQQATVLAASIAQEEGTENGANFFHCQLDLDTMRCSLAPTRVAVWRVRRTQVRLSALAATVLANEGLVTVDDLKLYRPQEYDVVQEPSDPISGTATGVLGAMADAVLSVTNIPIETIKAVRSADQERRGRKKPSNRPLATGHSATTLTSALTTPSGVLALSPDKSDASSSILTSQTTISSRFSEQTLLNDRDDFDMVHDTSTQEISPGQDGETFSNEAGRRSITNNLSGVSVQSSSAGSTLSGSSTQAPIGSRKMEIGPGERAGRFLGGTLRSPMDFTFTLARGFHNAPKLYGDTTVRRMDKVIDLQSGLKMAGKGLGYGLYDGLSGLVTQPINGAKGEGVAGFIKGVGKGLGGVVLKPCAAIIGVPAYTHRGIYKELRKSRGKNIYDFIIMARTALGIVDLQESTAAERDQIVSRWHDIRTDLKKG